LIIKLLEQPIIAINEASIAGTVDGVIIKDSRVSCIYHRNMENHFAIPVENAIIGSDAVMIQDMADMTLTSQNVRPLNSMLDVYNLSGKYLGCLQGIEVDDEFVVQYIHTENYRIEMKKAVNYESVIVVDIEEAEIEQAAKETCSYKEPEEPEAKLPEVLEEDLAEAEVPEVLEEDPAETEVPEVSEEDLAEDEALEEDNVNEEEAAITMDIGPDIKWNDENCQPEVKNTESSEFTVVRTLHHNEEKEGFPGVDAKYAYLCGKQLLDGIEIEDTFYDKGTIIDPDLIKYAIGNNAIVKVIVNAEE